MKCNISAILNQFVGMPGHPHVPANQLNLPFYVHKFKNVFLQPGTKEVKFVSEQLASYKHHILSAKEIGKSLLLGCPETSPFHQSIQAAPEICTILTVWPDSFILPMAMHF